MEPKPIHPSEHDANFIELMEYASRVAEAAMKSFGVPAHILSGDSNYAKADALGDACCRELERVNHAKAR